MTVYAHLPGVNALACLRAAGHTETLGEWFRQTRPDTLMPDWLTCRFAESPEEDPGHTREWESFLMTEEFVQAQRGARQQQTIDLLIHFQPLSPGHPCRNRRTNRPQPAITNARKPAAFPLGLIAEGLAWESQPDFLWRPRSPEAARLLEAVPAGSPLVGGESLALSIGQIHSLARLATWCDPMVWAILSIEYPNQATAVVLDIRPSFYVGVEERPQGMLISLKPKDKLSIPQDLQALEATLSRLPNGSILELVTGDYSGARAVGNQRYRGCLRDGVWHIQTAFPSVARDVLSDAVTFSSHCDTGQILARDPAEAQTILAMFHRASEAWCSVVKPTCRGTIVTLELDDLGELWNAARYVFAMRYADTWPAWNWWDEMSPTGRPIA